MYRAIVTSNSRKKDIVREYPPQKRTIMINGRYYCLQFPYMIFFHSDRLHLAFSNKPINSLNDLVYFPSLGNVYYSWQVCGCSYIKNLNKAIEKFWQTEFTDEGRGTGELIKTFGNYKNWRDAKTLDEVNSKIVLAESWTFKELLKMSFQFQFESPKFTMKNIRISLDNKYKKQKIKIKIRKKSKPKLKAKKTKK